MNEKKGPLLLRVLKGFGLFAGFLLVYPLCYLAWFLSGTAVEPLSLLALAAAVICGICGAGLRVLLERSRLSGAAGLLLAVCAIVLTGAVFFLFGGGLLPAGLVAAACLAAYVIGDRLVILPYDAVATRAFFTTALVSYLGCGLIVLVLQFSFHYQGGCLSLALMLFAVLAVHELAGNQAQIDFLMRRRGHRMDQLPNRIRRYNLALVLLILAVILAGLLFYRPIGTVLLFLGELLRQAAALVLRGILYLMSLFSSDESTGEDSAMGQQEMMPLDGENTGGNSDWILVILLLLIVGLAVWKRRVIWNTVRAAVSALLARLRSLFAVRRRFLPSEEETGYFDTVEELSREREAFRFFAPSASRLWKRELRALRRMPEGTAKLRRGYALLARGLSLTGAAVKASDTPAELLRLAAQASLGPEAEQAVSAYEEVRYNDREASATESAVMQTLLTALSRRL